MTTKTQIENLVIQNNWGEYWTGRTWTVARDNAETYCFENLPDEIGDLEKTEYSTPDFGGSLDIRYEDYLLGDDDDENDPELMTAAVREI